MQTKILIWLKKYRYLTKNWIDIYLEVSKREFQKQ